MRFFHLFAFVVPFVLSVAQALCQTPTIKIGYLAQVHDGPLLSATDTLSSEYKFEYVKFFRYTDAEIALSKGDIDVSSLGYVNAISAASRGGDAAFAFVAGQSRGAINLVCRGDAGVKDWPDLRGKPIGVLTGGTAEIFFDDALRSHNVDLEGVKKVPFPVPGPPLLQALKEKAMDCMAVYEPFAASAVNDGYGFYPPLDLGDNTFLGVNGGVAVNKTFLAQNKAFVGKLVTEVVKEADTLPSDRDRWAKLIVEKTGFKTQTVLLGMDHLKLDWRLYDKRIATLGSAVAALGLVKRQPSFDAVQAYFLYDFLIAAKGADMAALGKGQ